MSSARDPGDLLVTISPTSHPLVASYALNAPVNSTVAIEFGPTTAYGRSTAPVPAPPGGGQLAILVAGMMSRRRTT
jgi:hypothetical protein